MTSKEGCSHPTRNLTPYFESTPRRALLHQGENVQVIDNTGPWSTDGRCSFRRNVCGSSLDKVMCHKSPFYHCTEL